MFRFCPEMVKQIERNGVVRMLPRMTRDEVIKVLRTEFSMGYNSAVRIANDPAVLASFLEVEIVEEGKDPCSLPMSN